MNCCKCPGKLVLFNSQNQSTRFEWCSLCKGIWISRNDLSLIFSGQTSLEKLSDGIIKNKISQTFSCPECEKDLISGRVFDSKVIVDYCTGCNKYYFDENELNQLLTVIKELKLPKAKKIEWSQEEVIKCSEKCPRCVDVNLYGAKDETLPFHICLQCNGVSTKVETLQTLAKKSLFGPALFEFRRGSARMAICRHCHLAQEASNKHCIQCGGDLRKLTCLGCGGAYSEYQHQNLIIERCQICNAVWLDSGEFERFLTLVPDLKKVIEQELLNDKLNQLRLSNFTDTYALAIEKERRDLSLRFWGPFISSIIFY